MSRTLKTVAALLVPLQIFLLNYAHRIDADEGAVLAGGWNLFLGKTLYVDFFQCQAPLSFYASYLAFSLLGPHYSSALLFSMLLLLLSSLFYAALAYGLTEHYFAAILTTMLWILVASLSYPLINYNSHASFISIIFTFFFILRRNRVLFTAAAGMAAVLTFYFLQHRGVALAGAALLILAFSGEQRKKAHILSFLAGALIAAAYPLSVWGNSVISVLFEMGSGYLGTASRPLSGVVFLLALTVLCVLLLRRYGLMNRKLGELAVLQAALSVSVLNQPDIAHLGTVMFPLLIILALIVLHALRSLPSRRTELVVGVAILSCLAIVTAHHYGENRKLSLYTEGLLVQLNERVKGKSVFAFPMLPNLYFELQLDNPYYNSVLVEGMFPGEHFNRNLEILADEKPDIVITNYDFVKKYGFTKNNVIDRHIRSLYEISDTVGPFELWTRSGY